MLAATAMIIAPMAGCSGGTSGKSTLLIGRSARPSKAISPAFSAIRMIPSQRVMIPTSPSEISTATFAESTAAFVSAGAVPLKTATIRAMAMRPNQM
jgi:hypothetical protein